MRKLFKNLVLAILWGGVARKMQHEKPYIIAITGSVGKTSTKEAIATLLATSGRPVLKTAGNLGTEMGVPLSLLGFEEQPSDLLGWLSAVLTGFLPPIIRSKDRPYYVLEFASDHPGDIAFLAQRIPPDVGVQTQVAPAHLQYFQNLEDFVKEELAIFSYLKPGGYAVLNADDPQQRELKKSLSNIIWYGLRDEAPAGRQEGVWMHHFEVKEKGLEVTLDFVTKKRMDTIGHGQPHTTQIQTKVIGRHQLYPLLAAAAIGFQEKIVLAKLKKVFEEYEVPPGRGKVIVGHRDIVIIDDSYNSSPEAVKAGLRMLRPIAKKRRVVAILGQMNELGESTNQAHREIGKTAAQNADFLVAVGPSSDQTLEGAREAGMSDARMINFLTPGQLMDKMEQVVQRNDLVYVKASQNGMRLERIVKKLMAHPERAKSLLARQEAVWSEQ